MKQSTLNQKIRQKMVGIIFAVIGIYLLGNIMTLSVIDVQADYRLWIDIWRLDS